MSTGLVSISDVIDAWPTIGDFAADVGCGYEAARQMRRRASIPAGYWLRVTEAAERRGYSAITLRRLAELAAAPDLISETCQEAAE